MSNHDDSSAGRPVVSQSTASALTTGVLVAGDVMLDRYWFGDVHRISPEAPVPIVSIARCEDRLGGAANVARNIVTLGGKASLVGLIGDDDAAHCLQMLTRQAGIESHLSASSERPTIVKLRVIGRHQQLLRLDFDGDPPARASSTASALSGDLSDTVATLMDEHQVLVLSDYAKGALADVASIIRLARRCGKPVLVDPKGDDFQKYAQANILTPNKAELRHIVGSWRDEKELTHKAQSLRTALCVDYLLLTRAEEGMTLFDSCGAQHFPAQAREIFDVSGAGDTVIATLATWLASGSPLADAIAAANRAAGLAVAKLGTAAVTRDEMLSGASV